MTEPPPPAGGELDLRRVAIVSGATTIGARAIQSLAFLGGGVVLARLLSPESFGIFAMVVPIAVLATDVGNHSFQTVLIRHTALSDPELQSFFRYALKANAAVAAGLVVAGFVASAFFVEPRAAAIAAVWAVMLVLLTVTTFQEAVLKRGLAFSTVAAIQTASTALSMVLAIVAAAAGAGYWTLPLQVFMMEAIRAVAVARASPWRPRRPPRQQLGSLHGHWRRLALNRVAKWLSEQPDLWAVGRFGGATILGPYDTARRWTRYPFAESFFVATDVAVAALSRLVSDPARFERFAAAATRAMLALTLPITAFAGIEAEAVVAVLLGPQWSEAVPLFRWLAVAACAAAVGSMAEWILLPLGKTGRLLRFTGVVRLPVVSGAVLCGVWLGGALGVARAVACAEAALAIPALWYATAASPVRLQVIGGAAARPVISSVLAAALLLLVENSAGISAPPVVRLLAAGTVFAVGFLAAWHLMPGGLRATRELLDTVRELRPRRPDHPAR